MPSSEITDQGNFITTLPNFNLEGMDINSREFRQFIVILTNTVNDICMAINNKESGYYSTYEFLTGKQLYPDPALDGTTAEQPNRPGIYRKCFRYTTPLLNAGTTTIAHDLAMDTQWKVIDLWGTTFDSTAHQWLALPFAGVAADAIDLYADFTNIYIKTQTDRTTCTFTNIVIEYTKS